MADDAPQDSTACLPTSADDFPRRAAMSNAKAAGAHHIVRGVANTSARFPTPDLYLSQAHPEALVDPLQYFQQIGYSIPRMRITNNHIRARIQQVTATPPTMDQDERLVTEGLARPFEPYCFFPIDEDDNAEDGRTMGDFSARENPQSISHEHLQGSVRLIGSHLVFPYNHLPHTSFHTLPQGKGSKWRVSLP